VAKSLFSAAELAEIAAADAEIDAEPVTQEERDESRRRDYIFRGEHIWGSAEAKRAYREANREKIAEAQRAALRNFRRDHGLSQADLGDMLGISQQAVSFWETGACPMNMDLIAKGCRMLFVALTEGVEQGADL
jgi:DNA-binding XRE family transcriptional regulator